MDDNRLDKDVCKEARREDWSVMALADVLFSEEDELVRDLGGEV